MDATECFSTSNERIVQFFCGPSETCCGTDCCSDNTPFYIHWYFWLAMCMFLLVVVGFAISACRHFRKQRKYQPCCVRAMPEVGTDLLLNYHLMRADTGGLPLYEDVISTDQYPVSACFVSIPPPSPSLPPPPYSDCSNDTVATVTSANIDDGHMCMEPSGQPPPAYSETAVKTDEL